LSIINEFYGNLKEIPARLPEFFWPALNSFDGRRPRNNKLKTVEFEEKIYSVGGLTKSA